MDIKCQQTRCNKINGSRKTPWTRKAKRDYFIEIGGGKDLFHIIRDWYREDRGGLIRF